MQTVILFLIKQMSSQVLCILPNTLYRKSIIRKIITLYNITESIIWEHPSYFVKYNFNKKKLILHRASLKNYHDHIKSLFVSCKYITFKEKLRLNNNVTIYIFDPINILKEQELMNVHYIESPNFLLSKHDLYTIKCKYKKNDLPPFNSFFLSNAILLSKLFERNDLNFSSERYDVETIINNLKNRKPNMINDNKYVKEAIKYVETFFPNNIGNTINFHYPINHEQARIWLQYIIKYILPVDFTYRSLIKDESNMLDAVFSSSLNTGLLNPNEIYQTINKSKRKICYNSYLDLMQKIYFREYKRYVYMYHLDYIISGSNSFYFTNTLSIEWYNGETGMYPVNVTINKSITNAYISENEAIYIIGSYMVLKEIIANNVFRWFMEIPIDSYEWIMIYNVYESILRKSSIRRFLKSSMHVMSLFYFEQKFEWTKIWDQTLNKFKRKYKNKL